MERPKRWPTEETPKETPSLHKIGGLGKEGWNRVKTIKKFHPFSLVSERISSYINAVEHNMIDDKQFKHRNYLGANDWAEIARTFQTRFFRDHSRKPELDKQISTYATFESIRTYTVDDFLEDTMHQFTTPQVVDTPHKDLFVTTYATWNEGQNGRWLRYTQEDVRYLVDETQLLSGSALPLTKLISNSELVNHFLCPDLNVFMSPQGIYQTVKNWAQNLPPTELEEELQAKQPEKMNPWREITIPLTKAEQTDLQRAKRGYELAVAYADHFGHNRLMVVPQDNTFLITPVDKNQLPDLQRNFFLQPIPSSSK